VKASPLGAQMQRVRLAGAYLTGARITADLSGASLTGARLAGADLGADMRNQSIGLMRGVLTSADLRNADLNGANLSRADLKFAKLQNANLANRNLRTPISPEQISRNRPRVGLPAECGRAARPAIWTRPGTRVRSSAHANARWRWDELQRPALRPMLGLGTTQPLIV
jgi:hypothetical protein